jgi:uncharacterized repeat protein (TIGR04076 family)
MKKWYPEDWSFKIEVRRVGSENLPTECRLGLEPGDSFECNSETPACFYPTSFIKIFPGMEVVRCGGDLRNLGGTETGVIDFLCLDGAVLFRLTAEQIAQS